MFWRKKNNDPAQSKKSISDFMTQMQTNPDFSHFHHEGKLFSCWISFIVTLVDLEYVHRDLLPALYSDRVHSMNDIATVIPADKLIRTKDLSEIQAGILDGSLVIQESAHSS
ncbi:MAG: hypothetical protein ABF629_06825 [Sporolactobacillus sp.]